MRSRCERGRVSGVLETWSVTRRAVQCQTSVWVRRLTVKMPRRGAPRPASHARGLPCGPARPARGACMRFTQYASCKAPRRLGLSRSRGLTGEAPCNCEVSLALHTLAAHSHACWLFATSGWCERGIRPWHSRPQYPSRPKCFQCICAVESMPLHQPAAILVGAQVQEPQQPLPLAATIPAAAAAVTSEGRLKRTHDQHQELHPFPTLKHHLANLSTPGNAQH